MLKEPTPAPAEYEYGQQVWHVSRPGMFADACCKPCANERWFQDLSYMFDLNMYTYLGMCLTMTYLRKYAYTSLGMSFLMGAFAQVVGTLVVHCSSILDGHLLLLQSLICK